MRNKVLISVLGLILVVIAVKFFTSNNKKTPSIYAIETFKIDEGWGYSILAKDKIIIRQDIIPSIRSKKHFKTKQDAFSCGEIVLEKLQKRKTPKVTLEDLKEKGIDFN